MVIRAWLVVGILIIGVAWYLTVLAPPPAFQATASSSLDGYRQAGLMPQVGTLEMSTAIGHEVFELPAADAEHLKEEAASQMASMPGMNMPGMNMGGQQSAGGEKMPAMKMPGMNMDSAKAEAEHSEKDAPTKGMAMGDADKMPAMKMPGMNMDSAKAEAEPGMQMKMGDAKPHDEPTMKMASVRPDAGHGEEAEAGHGDEGQEAAGGHSGGGGLELISANSGTPIDRTIEIKMTEWGYSPGNIEVKPGEVVRFVVTNAGNVPHEFMIMTGPGMGAVDYRIQRADWSLTEHEAIYENSLVMPGDTFETVLKIDQPGAWMFMCMFPFHMQMGMMGMMMTEGMAGMNIGGMKM